MITKTKFTSVYSENFTINFLQCYGNGVIKHTELFNLLQMVAAKHADLGKIGLFDLQKNNQAWVLAKMNTELVQLPNWKQEITITTWIKSFENSKSIRCFEVFCEGKKLVGCETFWVVLNTKLRRPEALLVASDHWEKYPEKSAVDRLFLTPISSKKSTCICCKNVVLSDLDIVNHVNNIKYIEWCLDFLDVDLVRNQKIKTFEMHFLRELVLADSYEIKRFENTFFVSKNAKNCFVLTFDL